MTTATDSQKHVRQFLDPEGRPVVELPAFEDAWLVELLEHLLRIRCVDERMLKLQRSGRIGFVGSMKGLEGYMVGTAAALSSADWLWSGLREGGAALMRGLPLDEYVAQMYCNSNDTAKGRQMCNHFQHKGTHYPSWSSVIGTQIPHAVGAAFASARRGEDAVHSVYFGDGATSANGFHSGMNFAGVWRVPVVFVCVDNGWAISVPSKSQSAGESYADKAVAYGLPSVEVDGNDVLACFVAMSRLVEAARAGQGPSMLVCTTYRLMGHSSSDDPTKYRDEGEFEFWEKRDPVDRFSRFLESKGLIGPDFAQELEARVTREVDEVIHRQEAADAMPLRSLVEDVYAEVPRHLRQQYNDFLRVAERLGDARPGDGEFPL